eukprot:scaffold8708_cov179-Ochromonas_danica.AAC.3
MEQVSRFESLDVCAYEGTEGDSIEYCYRSQELYGIHPKSPMGGQATAREGVGKALCVEKKNYAFKHEFFTSSSLESSIIFSQSAGEKEYSYVDSNTVELVDSSQEVDNYYDQNDTIAALALDSLGQLVSSGLGYFALPRADVSGRCNDNSVAGFEVEVNPVPCERQLSSQLSLFLTQCVDEYSLQRYVQKFHLARSASTLASSGAVTSSAVVGVSLSSVIHEDWQTGAQSDITSSFSSSSCTTTASSNSTALANDACFFTTTSTSRTLLLTKTAVCVNFIKEVKYTIQHSNAAEGTITNVTAEVVVTDIPFDSSGLLINQAFGASFQSVDSSGQSSSNGNLVRRERSGNPGYIMGRPVLFGNKNLSANVINELVEGFMLPGPVLGCSLTFNRQQLKNFCCTGASGSCLDNADTSTLQTSPYVSNGGLPFFLNVSTGYIGIYGDADPLDVSQWFAMSSSVPTDSRAWSDRVNIQFLVSYQGERSNPQNKIIAALAEVVTSDWTFTVPKGDNQSTQSYQLTATVSFVFQDENDLKGYEPPAPPVLFKMPYDVFYPFLMNQGNSNSLQHASKNSLMVMVLVAIVPILSCFLF